MDDKTITYSFQDSGVLFQDYHFIHSDINGQYTDAYSAIDNFSPETNVETNYKAFFELYYSYITTTSLSTGAILDLEVLALQCPFKDGPAVYKARALYDLVTKSVVIYDDEDCLSSGYSERPAKSDSTEIGLQTKLVEHEASQVKLKTKTSFKIYPNPAEDVFYINTKNKSDVLNVQIRDVSGRILFSRAVENVSDAMPVEINLLNGIYFVTITTLDGFSQTKKLVISK